MDRKRPGSRVSMSGEMVSPVRFRSQSSFIAPRGLKNSGIFNYQTGEYEVSINPDSSMKMSSYSALQLEPGTSRTFVGGDKKLGQTYQGSWGGQSTMHTARVTDEKSSIQNLNGSFLQFDQNQKKLVDMSRQVLSSPRKHIVGEAFVNHNYSLSI